MWLPVYPFYNYEELNSLTFDHLTLSCPGWGRQHGVSSVQVQALLLCILLVLATA